MQYRDFLENSTFQFYNFLYLQTLTIFSIYTIGLNNMKKVFPVNTSDAITNSNMLIIIFQILHNRNTTISICH